MKNKLITIFAVIGAVAAIAGGVAYLLKVKKELDGITEGDQEAQHEEMFDYMFCFMCCNPFGMQQCEARS